MSCTCCAPPASDYRRIFRRGTARGDLRRYRRRGLPKTARGLAEAVAGNGTVLDIGGGIGTLAVELLDRGASLATVVELSDGYEEAAAELLAERGRGDRVERRIGDFVADAGLVEPHDAVVLHKVVCCYPDPDALVSASAAHARKRLALTLPRQRAFIRFGFGSLNLWLRFTGCGFRAWIHPFAVVEDAARREGLELRRREAQGLVWENAVFERATTA